MGSWRIRLGSWRWRLRRAAIVTWVEHVEVDDNIQANSLYKYVVSSGIAYGAERWLSEIQRMRVKLLTFSPYFKPSLDQTLV
ncbi:hypothetical protein RIF29_04587 [Crotalaria pallida]|uniref:Uncharacterized protein n=1 Tax=Crotalaria pallida TaxID=3830 RepID=A0AAN9PAG2_CROPI